MDRIIDRGENAPSWKNLPPLAGLATFPEAIREGLSVEECVRRLKRYHYALKRLHGVFNNRINSEPIYELKMALSLHSHLCAEHVAALRKRVSEMREPPLGLDRVPDPRLETLFDEILAAPTTGELLVGAYELALPALIGAMERHLVNTNPLIDHPSIRVCRFALLELNDMLDYGTKAIACLVSAEDRAAMADWIALLKAQLAGAGGLDGTAEVDADGDEPTPRYSAAPYVYDRSVVRDERFHDPYNMGVNAEVFLQDESYDDGAKVLMLYYKRLREIDVPEMMASIIAETPGKPWGYYRDMTRQLWDEARHAMMGEIGFISLGLDWTKVPINFTWSLGLNTQLKPLERHAVLYFIEQGLMPKSGKRYEWEVGVASRNPLAATIQDYDWADEVLHAQIGRNWYVPQFGSPKEATDYGDECWSKVLIGWREWKEQGLTEHRNWWPEFYREACEKSGIEPDPNVLAYHVTYETVRADLQAVSG